MADIYGRMNLIMDSMSTVCYILRKSSLCVSSGDIEFDGKTFSLYTQKIGGDADVDFE